MKISFIYCLCTVHPSLEHVPHRPQNNGIHNRS